MKAIRKLKNKKLNSKKIMGLASLILIGGIVSSCDSVMLNREYEYDRIEFNSYGEFKETRQFKSFDSNSNKDLSNNFTYYGAWELRDDGRYQREVKEYDISNMSYEEVYNIINSDKELYDFLKKPEKTFSEITDIISKDEDLRGSYYDVTIYSINRDRYADIDDTERNIWVLIGCGAIIPLGVGALIGWNRYNEMLNEENKKLTLKK